MKTMTKKVLSILLLVVLMFTATTLTVYAASAPVQPPLDGSIVIGSNYFNGGYTTWLQTSLKQLGFNPGTIDGLWGPIPKMQSSLTRKAVV